MKKCDSKNIFCTHDKLLATIETYTRYKIVTIFLWNAMQESEPSNTFQESNTAREEIIKNYDTGGKDDKIEEAEFDIHYIHYDRYGFVHDIRLNDNPRQSASEKKWMEKEKSREGKWIMMITDVKKWFTIGDRFYQKMIDRVWKGVPDKMRGTVWRILLNVDFNKHKQQGIYEEMK